jgi:hypothetical protein
MARSEEFLPYVELAENLLRPLIEATEDIDLAEDLLRELGYAPPSRVLAFGELSDVTNAFASFIEGVRAAVDADDQDGLLQQLARLLPEIGRAVQAISKFQSKIQQNFAGSPFLTQTDILTAIPSKLTDYLIVKYLEDYHPTIFAALLVGDVVNLEDVEDAPTPFHVPYRKRTINWDHLSSLLSDPIGSLKANFDSSDELLYDRLLYLLKQLGLALGLLPIFDAPQPGILSFLNSDADLSALDEAGELDILYFPFISDPTLGVGFEVYPLVDAGTGKYIGLALAIRAGAQLEIPLTDTYRLIIQVSANIRDGLGLRIPLGTKINFMSSLFNSPTELSDNSTFGIRFSIVPTDLEPMHKLLSLGAPLGTHFEIGSGSLSFGIEKLDTLDLFVEAELKDGLLSLKAEEADSFISKLLPAKGITGTFNFGVGFSNRAGLYFKGTSSLYIRLPLHLAIGPINIEYLGISFGFENDRFPLSLTSGFNALVGPLTAMVEDIGVRAIFKVKADRSGNLGPLDVSFAFKPPNGVGLAIDAGVIKGGGYLYFDSDKEEYAGALELVFSEFLTLKAIGLITTRMADGSKGFSLLIIITAEFGSPIQLSFGFTLSAVGGLLGLNRTMLLQPLAEGVRTGAVNSIMFPTNVIENAPRIISDLKSFFPPHEAIFLIGPMAKIGWGTPNIVTLSIGIVIQIPGDIAILGVLKVALPDEKAELLRLQVNFIGAIEFDKKGAWFFASMFDSRVLAMTIDGQMGVLVSWGDDPNFVVSVGGFHPAFNPPPLPFPKPNRIAISLLNKSCAKIRIDGYFAVTSNTAQFGARAEAYFGFSAFKLDGNITFDALFQFSPFYFIITISSKLSAKVFGIGIFSIKLRGSLEGPTPWHVEGTGSISIPCAPDIDVDFSHTWGEEADTALPPIGVMPLLKAECEKLANWQSIIPAANKILVSLRKIETNDVLVLHPIGILRISQRAVPLDLTIDKVGAQKPSDANYFTLSVQQGDSNDIMMDEKDANEKFAIAQFKEMADAKKLSAPAFENLKGGVDLSVKGNQYRTSGAVKRIVRYEQIIIDTYYKRFVQPFFSSIGVLFRLFLKGNAATKSKLSQHYKMQKMPFLEKIAVAPSKYCVAFSKDNSPLNEGAKAFASYAQAEEYMSQKVKEDATLEERLQVVPEVEVTKVA